MIEIEILKSMIIYPNDIDRFCEGLELKVFSANGRKIMDVILELKESQNLSINALRGNLEGGILKSDYFLNLLSASANPNYINLRGLLIKEYQLKRQNEIAQTLLNAAKNNEVLDITTLQDSSGVERKFLNVTEWNELLSKEPFMPKFNVGIDFLNSCFDGGIEGGQLVLISGDPEAGKTMLGLQILENIAKENKVAFFCFEFTIQGYLKTKQKLGLKAKQAENIIVLNDGYNINEIAYVIKTLYKQGLRVFFIDSQMRITSPAGRNMEEEESLKFSTLARLCHSLGIVVFLVVQTSKGDRDNPMGSKKGGHEASIIIRVEMCPPEKNDLMQKGQEFDENARIVLVKKNKQTGRHFKEKVVFDKERLIFFRHRPQVEQEISQKEIDDILGAL